MKQKRIKIIVISVLMGLLLFAGAGVMHIAYAEENMGSSETSANHSQNDEETAKDELPEEVPESVVGGENSPIFDAPTQIGEDEEIKEAVVPIVSGFAGLVGAALLYLALSGKLGKLKEAFEGILKWFKQKSEELVAEEIDVKELEKKFVEAVESNEEIKEILKTVQERNAEEYDAVLSAVRALTESMAETVMDIHKQYEKRVEEMANEYHQIKDVLIKLLAGNPNLVRSGVADVLIKNLEKETKVG